MEEEGSLLLLVSFFSHLTGFLCSFQGGVAIPGRTVGPLLLMEAPSGTMGSVVMSPLFPQMFEVKKKIIISFSD